MKNKTGKLPAKEDPRTLRLANYRTASPSLPHIFGEGNLYSDWGMLGNDKWGDCVEASAAHQTELFNKVRGGTDALFSTKSVLSDYGVFGGGPSTGDDPGTVVLDYLNYRRKTGVIDAKGARHKIAAYASIDAQDFDQMMLCVFEFAVVEIGFEVPDSCFEQFDEGEYWDVVPSSPIDGGHDVCLVGTRNSTARVTCVTWAQRQQMTRRFYERYNDEAYVILSEEMIRTDGNGIHGYDWEKLQSDLAKL